jgi:hypothetical protein
MKMKKGFLLGVLCLLLLAANVMAAFELDEDSSRIDINYLGGDFVSGVLNISFENQRNSNFSSNFKGGKSILDLFNGIGFERGSDYLCEPASCTDSFSRTGAGENTKSFNLGAKDAKSYGFFLNNADEINEFVINFSSDIGSRCENQLKIDLLGDGIIDFYNPKYVNDFCGEKNFGCFDDDDSVTSILGNVPYCENMTLEPGPAYRIGGIFSEIGNLDSIELSMYDSNGIWIGGKSDPPSANLPGGRFDVYTIIEHSAAEKFDAFICVRDSENSGNFKMKSRTSSESCGFFDSPSDKDKKFVVDYEIYAQKMKYGPIGEVRFDKEWFENFHTGKKLKKELENYLEDVYEGCEDCIIPMTLISPLEETQTIGLKSGKVRYKSPVGNREANKIYELNRRPFTIDSNDSFLMLDIEEMEFIVPERNGEVDFAIYLDSVELISEDLIVEVGFNFSVGPQVALIAQPTTFSAFTRMNISSSKWDFGDGSILNSGGSRVEHTYFEQGDFDLVVTLTNTENKVSVKRFKIKVGEPRASINRTLNDYENRIINIKRDIIALDEWFRDSVESSIQLSEIEGSVVSARNNYELSLQRNDPDENFIKILQGLIGLNVPIEIYASETGVLPLEIGFDTLDPKHAESLSGSSGSNQEELKSSIVSWYGNNYDAEVEYETISSLSEASRIIARIYDVKITPKGNSRGFLIIGETPSSIRFRQNYDYREISGGKAVAIPIVEDIEFIIVGQSAPVVERLGMYISPVISELGYSGKRFCIGEECEKEGFPWKFFLAMLGLLLVIVFITYVALQEWYKRYYERHLFKNKDDLYNLINFIYNSRMSGLKDNDIRDKLKVSKWKSEQIWYALRKIDGKRTGLWEIPVFKFFENKKVKSEIKRRQPERRVDARFIKRPSF